LDCAIVEDVLVENFNTHGQLLQTWGAVFNRVVLRGKIDRLMLSNTILGDVLADKEHRERDIAQMRKANAEYYRKVEWALDIRAADFEELSVRGVPTHLIRRDPETQVVVIREKALEETWRDLDLSETLFKTWLGLFLEEDSPSTILVAPKRHPKFRRYLNDLRMLQKVGVAEPD
jgi:hypothetical protein